jgi:hypothetical protein
MTYRSGVETAPPARFSPALHWLGVCALIGALTTFLNTILPRFYSATGFDERTALIHNPFYAFRQWVLLVHPAFTLLAALGLALALWHRTPGRAATGLIFAGVEKMTEFWLGVTILFVVNGVWKAGYLAAPNADVANALRAQIEGFNDILGGAYFLLWTMFILSTSLFASALSRRGRVEKWLVGTALVMIALTLLMIAGAYAGQGAWTEPISRWAYSPALTLHRIFIGVWLLREARALRPGGEPS